jgi:hypothetical protein
MLRSMVVLVGLIAVVTMTGREAAAAKRCAPVPVQTTGTPTCKCTVQNYSTNTDTGVNIVIHDAAGGLHSCNALTIPPRGGVYCHISAAQGGICGCVVTGEGASSLVSLSVTDLNTLGAQASVECH